MKDWRNSTRQELVAQIEELGLKRAELIGEMAETSNDIGSIERRLEMDGLTESERQKATDKRRHLQRTLAGSLEQKVRIETDMKVRELWLLHQD